MKICFLSGGKIINFKVTYEIILFITSNTFFQKDLFTSSRTQLSSQKYALMSHIGVPNCSSRLSPRNKVVYHRLNECGEYVGVMRMELFTNIERIRERSAGHSYIFELSIFPVSIYYEIRCQVWFRLFLASYK